MGGRRCVRGRGEAMGRGRYGWRIEDEAMGGGRYGWDGR